jgi:uncharacterized membrane protein YfcA
MEFLVVGLAAFVAAGLTLFSGFGLGTLLLPVFALFFPVNVAVGLTAVVHLLNNIFKAALLGKHASAKTALHFGVPAIAAAFAGAGVLVWFSDLQPLASYFLGSRECHVTPIGLLIALLIMTFAIIELTPSFEKLSFDRKYLPLGGILSGFFGGLSGHQGAFRSAFLLKCGLAKEAFIATGVVIACFVDVSRLIIYRSRFSQTTVSENGWLLAVAVIAAFLGVFIGSRLLKEVTMRHIRIGVSILLFGVAIGLGTGIF